MFSTSRAVLFVAGFQFFFVAIKRCYVSRLCGLYDLIDPSAVISGIKSAFAVREFIPILSHKRKRPLRSVCSRTWSGLSARRHDSRLSFGCTPTTIPPNGRRIKPSTLMRGWNRPTLETNGITGATRVRMSHAFYRSQFGRYNHGVSYSARKETL